MCIIAIAYRVHPAYPLVIAANRDEFYSRPTAPLGYWKDNPDILAGRDLKSHGTWLGMNKKGEIAAVTNFREPGKTIESGISRGFLVKNYLEDDTSPDIYLESVAARKNEYSGFNLVAGNIDSLFWYSNRGNGIKKIEPGIHGLSNRLLNSPWPKVEKIRMGISHIVEQHSEIEAETLFTLLTDTARPPDEMLPDTGIGRRWEQILSPVFVTSDVYGTRCSSVILVDTAGKVLFCERSFDLSNSVDTRCFTLYPENR